MATPARAPADCGRGRCDGSHGVDDGGGKSKHLGMKSGACGRQCASALLAMSSRRTFRLDSDAPGSIPLLLLFESIALPSALLVAFVKVNYGRIYLFSPRAI